MGRKTAASKGDGHLAVISRMPLLQSERSKWFDNEYCACYKKGWTNPTDKRVDTNRPLAPTQKVRVSWQPARILQTEVINRLGSLCLVQAAQHY